MQVGASLYSCENSLVFSQVACVDESMFGSGGGCVHVLAFISVWGRGFLFKSCISFALAEVVLQNAVFSLGRPDTDHLA